MRIDTYLCYLRYYASRSQASKACNQGHVRIEEKIIKPSREVFIGDKIKVRKNQIWRVLMVIDFPKSRVGAKIVNLYRQDITPEESFENANFQLLSKVPQRDRGAGRPTKKDRREIDDYQEDKKSE
jgi:ribosome-associated heat shock protein Hsp15